jgi:phosphatidylserine/phosphatidylglycerophosphate/cardiolipin synthase-like enzyme
MKSRAWLFVLLAACSAPATTPPTTEAPVVEAACEPLSPRAKPLEVFVQPDVGTAPFKEAIERATTSIDVMVYQMGYGAILEGLEAKARAGVKVRAVLDLAQKPVNDKYKVRLENAGATVVWSDPRFTFTHAKVIVVDRSEAIVSTGNYSESYMLKERNLAVRDTDPDDIAVLTKLFDADYAHVEPDLSCTRLLIAPVNARQRLMDFIASAKTSILVHSMQLGDKDVREALAARKAAGVEVRALLADPGWIDANAAAAQFLTEHAIPARWAEHVHVKTIVVDGKAAYVGSINLSWNSITKNREVGLLLDEPANVNAIMTTFEKDWATAKPF